MALSPKEREKIVEEETLRFNTRKDLQALACAQHPRRGRWLWVLALLLLAGAFWCHGRCYSRLGGGMMGPACYHGDMMGCSRHGWVVPPAMDGGDTTPPPVTETQPQKK